MFNLIRYYLSSLRYRGQADFISMGLGIEVRKKRCARFWQRHLDLCKEFQRRTFLDAGDSIAVLGAGRLYDLDIDWLASRFSEIHLFDYDPLVLPFWKRARLNLNKQAVCSEIHFHLEDLTASLTRWSKDLELFLDGNPVSSDVLEFCAKLAADQIKLPQKFNAVLSLNLLSQIPIYWFDRVMHLCKSSRLRVDAEFEAELHKNASLQLLQEQHLELLNNSAARKVALITDRYFLYYQPAEADWQEASALYCKEAVLKDYELVSKDSWFWHIAPSFLERRKGYGSIHEVVALSFKFLGSGSN